VTQRWSTDSGSGVSKGGGMSQDELGGWARDLLADLDALRPGRSLAPQGLTTPRAYALQRAVVRLREDRGERVIGYKIGCTSRVIQAQLGIHEPILGRVFDSGCFPAGSRLSHARFANLAVEGELAIRLARDLPGRLLEDDEYIRAIESIFPVIELHHYVLRGTGPAELIVTNGMHAGLVLPERETPCHGTVPPVQELNVTINEIGVGSTTDPWTMGGPAATLRWLSARLEEWGEPLAQGQVILTGSALPLYPVGPGSRVVAEARPLGTSFAAIDP
jgi:2-keto-4-pentenoate hydratase